MDYSSILCFLMLAVFWALCVYSVCFAYIMTIVCAALALLVFGYEWFVYGPRERRQIELREWQEICQACGAVKVRGELCERCVEKRYID